MNRGLIAAALLILISIIALSAGAPVSADSKQESIQNVTPAPRDDTPAKWWNIIRDNVLYPTYKLISDISKEEEKRDFKSASPSSIKNPSNNNTLPPPSTTTTTTPKPIQDESEITFLSIYDHIVYEIENLTFLGYIYIGILVIILLVIFCCTGCCCCCCGCCGCCRGSR